jgi:YD repeat-containing protein
MPTNWLRRMDGRVSRACVLAFFLAVTAHVSLADTVTYEYDALGRLKKLTYPDGRIVSYDLDPAGNRTSHTSTTGPPGTPSSITVPSSSITGSYTVSWDSSTGAVSLYQLYEATNSGFSGEVLAYSGTATSFGISGKGNGSYYYRVRGCFGSVCSGYRTGGNPTTVTLPAGIPASINVPSSSTTGSYTISWGTSTGVVTAYQLFEATNPSFSGEVQVYNSTGTSHGVSGKGDGSYYYRVRACNGAACSPHRTGSNPVSVLLPPGIPASISVPSSSSTGAYTISWGTTTGSVTAYELYEANNSGFSGEVLVYNSTGTSHGVSGRGNGTYYYRVRACNASGCSTHRAGANGVTVSLPPPPPPPPFTVSGPSSSNSGHYLISWSSSSGADRYELWESFDEAPFVKAYDGSNTSRMFNAKPDGLYRYRAKACSTAAGCSALSVAEHVIQVCRFSCFQGAAHEQE